MRGGDISRTFDQAELKTDALARRNGIAEAGAAQGDLLAVFAPDKTWFWAAGIVVGIFSGPNQAASRSLMGRFVPADKESEFYGFFAFSGKATAFLGPLLLGILTEAFQSPRAGIAVVILLFIVGGAILTTVDEEAGKAVRLSSSSGHGPDAR